jgi:glycosyltransferase involved in cell wall biosynthesis
MKAMNQLGLVAPILWISLPTAVDMVGSLGEHATVYYCCDAFGALDGVDHDPITRLEAELAARADMILTSSPVLASKFPGDKTHLVLHGVDMDLFSLPVPPPRDIPANTPVAGFYGTISEWLDTDVLVKTARLLPDWNFVFVGSVRRDVSALEQLPNVVFLGPRPHSELPGYSQNWNVSLIPFIDNAQIRSCNPLKLREYLAAGTPIVSTDFPALDKYRDLVSVADSAEAFASAIKASGKEHSREAVHKRRARVAGESWGARAQIAEDLLDSL